MPVIDFEARGPFTKSVSPDSFRLYSIQNLFSYIVLSLGCTCLSFIDRSSAKTIDLIEITEAGAR